MIVRIIQVPMSWAIPCSLHPARDASIADAWLQIGQKDLLIDTQKLGYILNRPLAQLASRLY